MKVELIENDYADISFANEAKVSIKGNRSYNVKWYMQQPNSKEGSPSTYSPVGDMALEAGTWGAFPLEDVYRWKIDICDKNGKLIASFDNNLANKPVIIVAKSKPTKVGKGLNFDNIKKYCTEVVNIFNCDLKVYFKGSCKFDFSDLNFEPLRLNDVIPDMYYGIEKEF